MKTEFYIVRHGQTLFNQKDLYQGWCDSPLQPTGIAQAKALHESLNDVDFCLAVSSTSERAMDTMDLILEGRKVPKTMDKGLREVYFGTMEGDHWPSCKPAEEIDWQGYAFCGGEDRDAACDRFMQTMASYARDGKILIVSHGGVICRMIQRLDPVAWQKRESPGLLVKNCSVTRVDYLDGQFHLVAYPDTSFIK